MSDAVKTKSLFDKSRRPFLLRKLHSLSGIVPLGGFLLIHLWTNAQALGGQDQFEKAVLDIAHMPYVHVLEIGVILLPLAFHALYGIKLALESKHNVGHYPLSRNWMYTMQRVTGLVALAFIVFHLYEYWWQNWFGRMTPEDFYPRLCANMSSTIRGIPVVAVVYLIGVGATVFHFANGLWGFCFSWGITISKRAQMTAAWVFGIVGLVVFFLGANTVFHFARGKALFSSGRSCNDIMTLQADSPKLGMRDEE